MGDYIAATKYYQRALPLLKKLKNYEGQSSVLANIGILHYKNKNIPEAIRYSKMSLKNADSISDSRARARENGNLPAYYTELKHGPIVNPKADAHLSVTLEVNLSSIHKNN